MDPGNDNHSSIPVEDIYFLVVAFLDSQGLDVAPLIEQLEQKKLLPSGMLV